MKRLFIIVVTLGLLTLGAIIAISLQIASYSTNRIYNNIESVPAEDRIAIVLGARIENDGSPSNTLYDRVLTGVELYKAGKTGKLLLSGGNNEPAVMKKVAVELGVPETDIVVDDLGTRTYESCIRAKQVFGIEKTIIVTQDYHLPRSLYLCQSMGVDSIGVDAKRREYLGERWFWVREYISRVLAWFDINFKPLPPEPTERHPMT
ncbi:MAG TPA: ElyC/SanA/YdcF family protein [Pyrinomonadaceae bacterium]|nr:ElyC/SanA/YdcF family protein [Pyrinomonadaceae bacterium]